MTSLLSLGTSLAKRKSKPSKQPREKDGRYKEPVLIDIPGQGEPRTHIEWGKSIGLTKGGWISRYQEWKASDRTPEDTKKLMRPRVSPSAKARINNKTSPFNRGLGQ